MKQKIFYAFLCQSKNNPYLCRAFLAKHRAEDKDRHVCDGRLSKENT